MSEIETDKERIRRLEAAQRDARAAVASLKSVCDLLTSGEASARHHATDLHADAWELVETIETLIGRAKGEC